MIKTIQPKLLTTAIVTKCPDCESEIDLPYDSKEGDLISCPGCGIELEIKKITQGGTKIELEEFIIEGEDWGE
ncbi:MAG: hypothetical protein GX638_11540 [Crenarchaeota archaeon]|nr:hypothetical protein [Thermoproteota archaeon]